MKDVLDNDGDDDDDDDDDVPAHTAQWSVTAAGGSEDGCAGLGLVSASWTAAASLSINNQFIPRRRYSVTHFSSET